MTQPLGPGLPAGLLLQRAGSDIIVADSTVSAVMRTHAILHELAHLLLQHTSDATVSVDPQEEREAEIAADVLALDLRKASLRSSWIRTVGPHVSRLRRAELDLHLTWLWVTIRSYVPEISLSGPVRGYEVAADVHGHRGRYRRLVEIHDGMQHLRGYYSVEVRRRAFDRALRYSIDHEEAELIAEATELGAALALKRRSIVPTQAQAPMDDSPSDIVDADHEAARLARIAKLLHTSPLVASELARFAAISARPKGTGLMFLAPNQLSAPVPGLREPT
ncbi:DUF6545 domain-containing protein [Micromonospora haikouensis]|uniref:DUF6545 domain-containing protein n=1 Tax=Micromonospora haikouensis TaxID=686309 RepID=UPI0036CBAB7B